MPYVLPDAELQQVFPGTARREAKSASAAGRAAMVQRTRGRRELDGARYRLFSSLLGR
jgi:hypothetical protein